MENHKIDCLIAKEVMGWEVQVFENINAISVYTEDGEELAIPYNFCPSKNIQDAGLVVEKLDFDVKITKYRDGKPKYQAHVFIPNNVKMAFADTAPMAICLAALKAVDVEVES